MVTIKAKTNELSTARIKKGFSLRQLGDAAGVNYVTLSRIESGKTNPNPATASKICKALEVEFDEIFEVQGV